MLPERISDLFPLLVFLWCQTHFLSNLFCFQHLYLLVISAIDLLPSVEGGINISKFIVFFDFGSYKLQSFSESRDDYDKSLDKNIQLVKQLLSDFDECFDQVNASNKPSPQRSSSVQASYDISLPVQQSFCIGSPVPQQPSVSTDSVTLASTATQQRQSKELEAKRIRLKCLETEIEIRKQTAELEALLELKSAQSDYLLSLDDHDQTLVKQIDSDERFRSDTKTDSNNNNHVTFSSSTPHGQPSQKFTSDNYEQPSRIEPVSTLNASASAFKPKTIDDSTLQSATGLSRFLIKKDLILNRLSKFDDNPMLYVSWKIKTIEERKTNNELHKANLCPIHKTNHLLNDCTAFRKKPLSERRHFILTNSICFKCCGPTKHRAANCICDNIKCAICKSPSHPTALHVEVSVQEGEGTKDSGDDVKVTCTQVCGYPENTSKSCAKIIPVRIVNHNMPEKHRIVYAMIDDQSSHTLATSNLFNAFQDHGPDINYSLISCAGKVQASENPADLATRPFSASDLPSSKWIRGPSCLTTNLKTTDDLNFPLVDPDIDKEVRTVISTAKSTLHVSTSCLLCNSIDKFSKWSKLVCLVRLMKGCMRRKSGDKSAVTTEEAEIVALKHVQNECFHTELEAIGCGQNLPKNSSLISLNPILDNNGVLRVGGRIRHMLTKDDNTADLPLDKHPILDIPIPVCEKRTDLLCGECEPGNGE
ncbi:unnamed protein product [Mytilus edulis]|uniref:Uncharacterized protein n=1 Tax=Mytilus edulis TaxID=6550 RepID=A0A8S3U2P1_MYTED|nr:unnamed protein product [Mytilus edulis]